MKRRLVFGSACSSFPRSLVFAFRIPASGTGSDLNHGEFPVTISLKILETLSACYLKNKVLTKKFFRDHVRFSRLICASFRMFAREWHVWLSGSCEQFALFTFRVFTHVLSLKVGGREDCHMKVTAMPFGNIES